MAQAFDVIVIGAGIAGASVAATLAPTRRVVVLERESQAGYHSTGRSAALFSAIYGGPAIRSLTRASRPFFTSPPPGFSDGLLISRRGALYIAREDQLDELEAFAAMADVARGTNRVGATEACRLSPLLAENYVSQALHEPDAQDIDVNALHQGYLRRLRNDGGELRTDAPVQAIERRRSVWRVTTPSQDLEAPILVNGSGAWADEIAMMAGAAPVGLTPRRRTAVLVEPASAVAHWERSPLTIDIDEQFYFKPDAGLMLLSPADEQPIAPCDVQPDEFDIAVAIDRFEKATKATVRRVRARWAGLRSFVADRRPVVGFDDDRDGLFWLAGQGGYGIQIAPALGRLAAALVMGDAPPNDIMAEGLDLAEIAPSPSRRASPAPPTPVQATDLRRVE
jgi:D-arginine dehydrogenase